MYKSIPKKSVSSTELHLFFLGMVIRTFGRGYHDDVTVNSFFLVVGLILIITGVYYLWRLDHPRESDGKTGDGRRLINFGFGQYQREDWVGFDCFLALLFGVICITIGLVI